MPEEGVFTENGYLFHHETPVPLSDAHKQRLLEYGIILAFRELFTPEEDQRIRKNWRAFAREHELIYEDARYYAGFAQELEPDVARDPSILAKNWLNRERYRMFFEAVLTKSSLSHAKVAELLQSSPEELKNILRAFNWTTLIPSFPPLTAKELKRAWRILIKELRTCFFTHLETLDEYQAWNVAVDEVMPCVRFSLRALIYYVKSLRKCIDKNATIRSWHYIGLFSKHSNNEELRNAVVDPHRIRQSLFEDPENCLYGPSPSSRQLYPLHHGSDEEASCSISTPPSAQVYPVQENTDDPPRKRRRHSAVSNSSSQETEQVFTALDTPNVATAEEKLPWHPDEPEDGSARTVLPEPDSGASEETTQGSSYDIFGDVVDETILAGNIMSAERSSFDRSSPEQPIPSYHSPSLEQPTLNRQPSGSAGQSPEPSQKQNALAWDEEEDGFSNLKISIPSRTAALKTPEPADDNDVIIPKEGWMQFLTDSGHDGQILYPAKLEQKSLLLFDAFPSLLQRDLLGIPSE
ncbi:hypothetical protein ANCDUO_02166 [Ancylostoma duodenale]|uniref:Uncharacterized protein n=1 Tax=Ancylostoma duodenale TaxID=51022 RepID=A0A0C2H176_9BILA|nr:hypothetical protein ANCDUO_02166 [Ancylostoma duodenale]